MERIEPNKLTENFFENISNEWMLITAGDKEKFNTMTASWGGIGYLWNKPVAFIFVRPERYTFEFLEKGDYFTVSFLGMENKDIHKICGKQSGRDIDKVKETGLVPHFTEMGNVCFEQSRITLECKKLYSDQIKKEGFADPEYIDRWYNTHGNFHQMYVAEIVNAWV